MVEYQLYCLNPKCILYIQTTTGRFYGGDLTPRGNIFCGICGKEMLKRRMYG